jgi:hypothetical protein
MMTDNETTAHTTPAHTTPVEPETPRRALTPEAVRALAEAEARRRAAAETARPTEIGGQAGPDPVRYGDWEKGGIASDF